MGRSDLPVPESVTALGPRRRDDRASRALRVSGGGVYPRPLVALRAVRLFGDGLLKVTIDVNYDVDGGHRAEQCR